MPCRTALTVALVLLTAEIAAAQAGGLEKKLRETDPRPGQRWVDGRPEIGVKEVRVHESGKELQAWYLPPGGEATLKIGGQNRLLVQSRPQLPDRGAPEYAYVLLWSLDGAPEKKKHFRTKPHPKALFEGGIDGVPGIMDDMVVDIPEDGTHTVVFKVPADAKAGVVLRFRFEEPKPSGQSYGSTTGPNSHRDTFWMGTASLLTFGYEDNAFSLTNHETHDWQEHKNNDPTDRYDRMASVGDFFLDSRLDAYVVTPESPVGRFFVGGIIDDRWYFQNHRLSHDTFGAYVKHQILPRLNYKLFGSWGPDRFYKNLNPAEVPGYQRAHAHYDRYEIGGRAWWRIAKPLAVAAEYRWEMLDWNGSFNERDSKAHCVDLELQVKPAKWLTLGIGVDTRFLHALNSAHELDRSFREFGPKISADFHVKRVLFGGSYSYTRRIYSTDQSRTSDPYHADRVDQFHEFRVYIGYVIGTDTKVRLAYSRLNHTVDLPGREGRYAEGRLEKTGNSLEISLLFLWP